MKSIVKKPVKNFSYLDERLTNSQSPVNGIQICESPYLIDLKNNVDFQCYSIRYHQTVETFLFSRVELIQGSTN